MLVNSVLPSIALGKPVLGHLTLSDVELLQQFVQHRREEAFSELVRRHSGIVWGVCRRVLVHQQDAEDAFQASFIILARKAHSLRDGRYLSSWLYSVAFHAARNVRKMKQRRRQHEASTLADQDVAEAGSDVWSDVEPILDEELKRLPRKYQLPLILCCIEGKTQAEAGALLSWPTGTIAARLSRGREMLRKRLSRRGVAISSSALSVYLTTETLAVEPPRYLLERCWQLNVMLHANSPALREAVGLYQQQLLTTKVCWSVGAMASLALLAGGFVYWNTYAGSNAVGTMAIGTSDSAVMPNPRYIALPREAKATVLAWKKQHLETNDVEQSITILTDGSMKLEWKDKQNGEKVKRQQQLAPTEWQELLQFTVHDTHFFQFDASSEWKNLLKEYDFDGDLRSPSDVWKTAIELDLPQKHHQVEWDQLGSTEAWFHEHASIRQLSALSQRLANYIVVEKAGGRKALEPICQQLNEQLRKTFPNKPAFTTYDLVNYQPATDAKPVSYSFSVGCKFFDPHFWSANCTLDAGKVKLTSMIPGPSTAPPRMKKRDNETTPLQR